MSHQLKTVKKDLLEGNFKGRKEGVQGPAYSEVLENLRTVASQVPNETSNTWIDMDNHRRLFVDLMEQLGYYDQNELTMPIFCCRNQTWVDRRIYDIIYYFRYIYDSPFKNKSVEADEPGTNLIVTELRDVYDLRHFRLSEFLLENPYDKYIDFEDPEYKDMKILRFISHHPISSTYLEIDAAYVKNYDLEDSNMIERIVQCKDLKKYMLLARVHEKKLFSWEYKINGIEFSKRETIETWSGKDYNIKWQSIEWISRNSHFPKSLMQTQHWPNQSTNEGRQTFLSSC